jgi:hypothetical protein
MISRRLFLGASGAAVATVLGSPRIWIPSQKIAASEDQLLSWLTKLWNVLPPIDEPRYMLARMHAADIEKALFIGQKIHRLTPNGPSPLFQFTGLKHV